MIGKIIGISSLNTNVGATSIALTLAAKLDKKTKDKKICIVDMNLSTPGISKILNINCDEKNINKVMTYLNCEDVNSNIKNHIEYNSFSFKNSNISAIVCSKSISYFSELQLKNLINQLKNIYDLTILDFGNMKLEKKIGDSFNLHLIVGNANYKFIEELNNFDFGFNFNKAIILNNYNNDLIKIKNRIKLNEKEGRKNTILGTLASSNSLNKFLAKGIINVDDGRYSKDLDKLAINVLENLDIEFVKRSRFSLIKKKENVSDTFIYKNKKLGELLLEKNYITKEQLEEVLALQTEEVIV